MSKLFNLPFPLLSGEIEGIVSNNGSELEIVITLPYGTMQFSGVDEAAIRKDILKALRALASNTQVPDQALLIASEVLTDLKEILSLLDDQMENSTATGVEDILSQFFTKGPSVANTSAPTKEDEDGAYISTPFGPVRVSYMSVEDLPESLRKALQGESKSESTPEPTRPFFYS